MTSKIPRRSPVSAVLLRADNDRSGNPRRVFLITCPRGMVEVIEEGYNGDGILRHRWPWFDHRACDRLGLETAYYVSVDTTPGEIRRLERWEEHERAATGDDRNAYTAHLRDAADRQHARSAAWDAADDLRRGEVHVHRHDPHRSAKLRALRAVPGATSTDHGHVITFRTV